MAASPSGKRHSLASRPRGKRQNHHSRTLQFASTKTPESEGVEVIEGRVKMKRYLWTTRRKNAKTAKASLKEKSSRKRKSK